MKRIIRPGTFETNSSSSHSLIIKRQENPTIETFPRKSNEVFKLSEYGVSNGHEEYADINKLMSEVDKARYMLNVIAAHIDINDDYYPDVNYWIDYEHKIKNENRGFSKLIQQTPFVWFKELLEERTGTKFEFIEPKSNYFPYYDAAYYENAISDEFNIDFEDEHKFKTTVENIVFDENVIIIDADIPYGGEDILDKI